MSAYGQTNNKIILGTVDSIYSKTLKEYRKVSVHLPLTEPDEFSTNQKYPVIYVLDGDFLTATTISENLSGGSGNFTYPKMIVVAITNTDRIRDLTPTHSTDGTVMPSFLLETSGGGDNFNTFLEKELIPYIDAHYPAAPYRALIGHSLGGLTVISNLINQNNVFNAFIAIDPSMWWDQSNFLNQTKQALQRNRFDNKILYLAIANTMDKKFTLQTVLKDKSTNTLPIRSILELDQFIKQHERNGLVYKSKYYKDYDHSGVALVAQYDGLPFLFNFYALNFPFSKFFDPAYKNDSILINHYRKVSDRMGYKISPPGEFVDAVAHQLIDSKQCDRAYKFLQLNIDNYPDSFKPYDSMGDFYRIKGDNTKAKEYYLKALAKKENPDIRTKIEKLKRQKTNAQLRLCASEARRCYISYVQALAVVPARRTKPCNRTNNQLLFIN